MLTRTFNMFAALIATGLLNLPDEQKPHSYPAGLTSQKHDATSMPPIWCLVVHWVDLGGKRFLPNTDRIRRNTDGPRFTQWLCTK